MQPGKPANIRSRVTGTVELRKEWSVPDAKYIYGLFVQVETQTAELEDGEPNWDKVETKLEFANPQGFVGDEEWAKKQAEHFKVKVPKEEYKPEEE